MSGKIQGLNNLDYKKESVFKLNPTAKVVLERRYLKKDAKGKPCETPEDMLWRVAGNIASVEKKYGKTDEEIVSLASLFYKMMCSLDFLPNSPTLMNAGRELQQLAACFVLPIEDSMDSIFEAIKQTAIIHKTGGGTGFSFSSLRPSWDPVASTGGVASGPLSFMKVFNSATDVVKQGGTRRGANMGILRVDHPDIIEFITAKSDNNSLTNFNLSVAITDEFMEALKDGVSYNLINPNTGKIARKEKASDVFNLIVEMAWKNGEPGIIFIDRINSQNTTPHIGKIESTNPCGEQPLLPYESCNLGSINLANMLKKTEQGFEIDWDRFESTIMLAVRFLDDVIDANRYPLEKIREVTLGNRKIGLGIMGFADMLIKMQIPYNSPQALKIAEKTMKFLRDKAIVMSQELAMTRGEFPNFKGSVYDKPGAKKLRNATLTTIAPTGSISIIAGCSSGIEPLFALSFVREILDGDRLIEIHPEFEKQIMELNIDRNEIMEQIAKKGSIASMEQIPKEIKEVFVISHDIKPSWHVMMQSAFQKYTDNAVSKTVNFPMEATKDDVKTVFINAYYEGCKGITVYRYGSRESQVLNIQNGDSKAKEKIASRLSEERKIIPRERPDITQGSTEKVPIGCGNIYVTVNSDDINLCEVFTQTGKGGGCPSQSEAVGRLVSLALRSEIDPQVIINQLKGIRCVSCTRRTNVKVLSCPDAISRVMEKVLSRKIAKNKIPESGKNIDTDNLGMPFKCPECRNPIEAEGRCFSCRTCGYSKCG